MPLLVSKRREAEANEKVVRPLFGVKGYTLLFHPVYGEFPLNFLDNEVNRNHKGSVHWRLFTLWSVQVWKLKGLDQGRNPDSP